MSDEIDEFNRKAAEANRKQAEFYQWLCRQKFPLSRELVEKVSAFKLEEIRDAGIKRVGVLVEPGRCCEAAAAIGYLPGKDGVKIEIEFAQPLPLPGCNEKHCMCDYIAVE